MDESLLAILSYTLLALTLLSLWASTRVTLWGGLLIVAATFGLASGRLGWLGLAQICGFGAVVYFYYTHRLASGLRLVVGLCIVGLSLALFTHRLPGFNNWAILSNLQFSSDSVPYSMHLNWDKPVVAVFIVAFGLRLAASKQDWQRVFMTLIPLVGLTTIVMVSASFALGYIRWDPKLPGIVWVWGLKNLFFTCLAEEALFRGFIQKEVSSALARDPFGRIAGLILASVLFGLAHFAGGTTYVVLATVAGMLYGIAYVKTDRIEASILLHFVLNLVHFLGFSYPALRAAVGE